MFFGKKNSNFIRTLRKGQEDNHGFSLVELIIATAILAIVLTAVTSFMIIGTKNYSNANNEVTVQQEVQQAVNQIADAIIDASWSVGIEPKFVTPGENTKMLAVYNGIPDDPAQPSAPMTIIDGREKNYVFYWKAKTDEAGNPQTIKDPYNSTKDLPLGALYYTEFSAADLEIGPGAVTCLLADNVTEFMIDTSEALSKNAIGINVEVIRGNRTYTASANVTIRNKVLFNAYVPEYNDEDLPTITISAPLVVYLEPGDSYSLTATVNGQNVDTLEYHWEDAAGNTLASGSTGISIEKENNNALKIGGHLLDSAAYRSEHVIYAVSDAVDNKGKHARSMPVRIRVKRVREVRIDAVSDTVEKGDSFNLTGSVVGDYLNRACSVTGHDDTYTYQICNVKYSDDGGVTWKDCGSSTPFSVGTPSYTGSSFSVPVTVNSSIKTGTFILRAYSSHSVNTNGGYNALTYSDRVRGEVSFEAKGGPDRPRRANVGRLIYGYADNGLNYGNFAGEGQLYLAVQIYDADGNWVREILMTQSNGGRNMCLDPDMFGVDWTKDYIIRAELFDVGKNPSQSDFTSDYNANLDENRYYTGSKYSMIYGVEAYMTPPTVNFRYEGENGAWYCDSPLTVSAFRVGTASEKVIRIEDPTGLVQPGNKYVGLRVQKNENGNWVDYGYANMTKRSGGSGVTEFSWAGGQNDQGTYNPANGKGDIIGGFYFKSIYGRLPHLKMENKGEGDVSGNYRLVPYIVYKIGELSKTTSQTKCQIFYQEGKGADTNWYSLECPNSTIYFSIVKNPAKYNVHEIYTYITNSTKKGEIYFPTPDKAEFKNYFTFDENSSETKQYTNETVFEFKASDGQTYSTPFSKIKCSYDKNIKTYTLQFFYNAKNYDWNRTAYDVDTATYTWKKGEKEWTKTSSGSLDPNGPSLGSTIKDIWVFWGTRVYQQYKKGNLYVPLPWEKDFIDKIGVNNTKTSLTQTYTMDYNFRYNNDSTASEGNLVFSRAEFKCEVDPAHPDDRTKDKYTLELYYEYVDSTYGAVQEVCAGKWEAYADPATSKEWRRVQKGDLDDTLNNNQKPSAAVTMSDLKVHFWGNTNSTTANYPLPGTASFTFTEAGGTKNQTLLVIGNGNTFYITFEVTCTYDSRTGKYRLKMYTTYDNYPVTTTYEAKAGDTKWTKIG